MYNYSHILESNEYGLDDDEYAEGSLDASFENEDVDDDGCAVGQFNFRNCFAGHH